MSGIGARLLEDHPSTHDSFGPHNRVAEGIVHLVEGSDGGKTVAIQGGWGSGKSTVIKLLTERYAKTDTLVFVYDAWVHVGDPLRRAFLSSLIEALSHRVWLTSAEHWKKEQEKLAGRRKESTKHTIPKLTKFAKFLGVAFLFVPVGLSLVSEGIKRLLGPVSDGAVGLLAVGGVLSLLPAIGLVLWLLGSWLFFNSTDEVFAFFLNRTLTNESTITTETGAATSIDFQKVFSSAVGEALEARYPSRKLIVVIDNLDRLEEEAAKEVWALLRSFLDMPQHQNAGWSKRVWVIVPIAASIEKPGDREGAEAATSEGFLTKIFQARFELPPPVLKNWRPYLQNAVERAFPNIERDEKKGILDLYLSMLTPGRQLTPRELLGFVNDLVALALQWGDKMPLGVLAAYLLDTRNLGSALGVALQSGDVPSDKVSRVLERSPREEFAMIYFNTGDTSEALDLLQRPHAEELLSSGEGEKLLAAILKESSFALVASKVLEEAESWAKFDISRLFLAISAVMDAAWAGIDAGQMASNDDLADLYQRAKKLAGWTLNDLPSAPVATPSFSRMVEAVLRTEKSTYVGAIVNALSRRAADDAPSMYQVPGPGAEWDEWLKGCVALAKKREVLQEISSGAWSPFQNLSAQQFLLLLNEFDEWSTFDVLSKASRQEPTPLLRERIDSRTLQREALELVRWCEVRAQRKDLGQLAPDLERALSVQDANPLFVLGAVEILCELRDLAEIRSVTERLVVDGVMHHHLWGAQAMPEASGAIAWCILHIRPGGAPNQAFGNSASAMSLINQFLAATGEEGSRLSKAMLEFCDRMEVTNEWVRSSIQHPHLNNILRRFCQNSAVLQNYVMTLGASEFRASIDDLIDKLGHDLHGSEEVSARFTDEEFCDELVGQIQGPEDAWLMTLALKLLPEEQAGNVARSAVLMLRALGEDAWASHLARNQDMLDIMRALSDRGISLDLGNDAKSALQSMLAKFKLAKTVDDAGVATFEILRTALSPDVRMSLDDQAYEDLAIVTAPLGGAWSVLEPIVKDGLARHNAMLRIGRRLLLPTLKNGDIQGIASLTRILSEESALGALRKDPVALGDVREEIKRIGEQAPVNAELVQAAAGLLPLVSQ